jgi:hypothetical protein
MKKKPTYQEDVADVLKISAGRRFLRKLIDECGVDTDPYIPGDTHGTARETGRRALGYALINMLRNQHPEMWLRMCQEDVAGMKTDVDIPLDSEQ